MFTFFKKVVAFVLLVEKVATAIVRIGKLVRAVDADHRQAVVAA